MQDKLEIIKEKFLKGAIDIKNYLKNRGHSCSIKTIMKNILKP